MDGSSKADAISDVSGFNAALGNLSSTVRLLNPTYSESFEEVDGSLLVFTDLKSEVNNVAKKLTMNMVQWRALITTMNTIDP